MLGRVLRGIFALSFLSLGACASIVEGTDQTVTVITDPSGANCTLMRDGEVVAVANPTPSSVVVDKSKNDISVLCEMEEHFDGAATLDSSFQGMTFGNIIFGGIIGVGVDAASGAMNEYPSTVTVILPPESFETAQDRDNFFDRQVARVTSDATNAVLEVNDSCNPDTQNCDGLIEAIEEQRDARIAVFEQQRDSAEVEDE